MKIIVTYTVEVEFDPYKISNREPTPFEISEAICRTTMTLEEVLAERREITHMFYVGEQKTKTEIVND